MEEILETIIGVYIVGDIKGLGVWGDAGIV